MKIRIIITFTILLLSHNIANAISYDITQFSGNDSSLVQRQTSFQSGDNANILNNITADRNIGDFGIRNFTVNGNGNIINGASTYSGFYSGNNLNNYTLDNIKMNNFYTTGSGSAIYNTGAITLTDGSFNNNTASNGGAIYNITNASTISTITNVTFNNNNASSTFGGAIYNINGIINISGTSFDSNSATRTGGAIYNKQGEINISGGSFSGNYTTWTAGAIYNGGTLSIKDGTTFTNNGVDTNNVISTLYGGTIYNDGLASITNATFENNKAKNYGGAILNTANLNISNSSFSNNYAGYAAAILNSGTVNISGGSFSGNYANNAASGAIYNSGTLTISNGTTFTNNGINTNGTPDISDDTIPTYYGGAIYNNSAVSTISTITDAVFENNAVIYSGGAIDNNSGTVNISGGSFSGNYTTKTGSSSVGGGAIYNADTLNITNSTNFTNNGINTKGTTDTSDDIVSTSYGGAIYNNTTASTISSITDATFKSNASKASGGAIYNNSGILNISGTTFDNNLTSSSGGAIYNKAGVINISGGSFSNNYITDSSNYYNGGGALYNDSSGTLNISGGTYSGNYTTGRGGVIYNDNIINITNNANFTNNGVNTNGTTDTSDDVTSNSDGGVIFNHSAANATSTITDAIFKNNSTTASGGAILNLSGILNISGGSFSGNYTSSATIWGGGAINNSGTLNITGTTFTNNGINTNGTDVTSDDVVSTYRGGALNNSSIMSITNATFNDNKSTYQGGAIYNGGTLSTLSIFADNGTTSFSGNEANNLPNDLYLYGGTVYLNAGNNGKIIFNDGIISSTATNPININSTDGSSTLTNGIVDFYCDVSTATMNIFGGTTNFGKSDLSNIDATNIAFNITGGNQNFINTTFKYGSRISLNDTNSTDLLNINNSIFNSNGAYTGEGSIMNITAGNANISDTNLSNYSATGNGGAIYNAGTVSISGGTISSNTSTTAAGGAIYNSGTTNITNSSFTGNTSKTDGGAIYNSGTATITNTSFVNNTSTSGNGGAIYNSGTLNIIATDGNTVSFTGNKAGGIANDIYLDTGSTLNLNAGNNAKLIFNDTIISNTLSNIININKSSNSTYTTGTIIFNDSVSNSTINLYDGFLSLSNSNNLSGDLFHMYGGSILNTGTTIINTGTITGNSQQINGALVTSSGSTTSITNSSFTNNNSQTDGGAINNSGLSNVTTSSFNGNISNNNGGAVLNTGTLNLTNSNFTNNIATSGNGGAIYNSGTLTILADNNLSKFVGNYANNTANDLYLAGGTVYLNAGNNGEITFNDNIASSNSSNAINVNSTEGSSTLTNGIVDFYGGISNANVNILNGTTNVGNSNMPNSSQDNVAFNITGGSQNFTNTTFKNGARISVNNTNSTDTTNINGSNFMGNSFSGSGSAINASAGNLNVSLSNFSNYSASNNGGTIYSKASTAIANSSFNQNSATNGGAIYNDGGILNLIDSSFTNNNATNQGGAIYNKSGVINIMAMNSNTSFSQNTANGDSNAIYLENGTLNLNAGTNNEIRFDDKIKTANSTSAININKAGSNAANNPPTSAPTGGKVTFNESVSPTTINLYNGTLALKHENLINNSTLNLSGGNLDLANHSIGTMSLANLSLTGRTNLAFDADLTNNRIDAIASANTVSTNGSLNISSINMLSDANQHVTSLNIADSNIKNYINLDINRVLGPIYKYDVNYNQSLGQINFVELNNSLNDLNPAVLSSSVATNIGGYITQLNTYQQAFFNMDMIMCLPKMVREEEKFANRYASADTNSPMVFSPLFTPEESKGLWYRPYTTFERVPLVNGPTVSNIAYGSIIGGDTDLIQLKHGFDGVFTLYAGYNGSHQTFDSVGIYQNGGVIGATGSFYKGNFFTGITANVGSNGGVASNMYGEDTFTLLTAGLASKTGYNWELLKGKFIVQPSFLISYTFVKTFDYTNAAGVSITSKPLNAIQLEPGLKLICNLKNGWQPYLSVSMVWNIMDQSRFYANDVALPPLSINPYVEYGVGVQKRFGERITGFAQAMIDNGGRNGIGFTLGFRWAL